MDSQAAQAYRAISPEHRRKLELVLSMRLTECLQSTEYLEMMMRRISREAVLCGITPKIVQDILDDED